MIKRMILFFSIIGVIVLLMTLSRFQELPVNNEKFSYEKTAAEHFAQLELIKKMNAPKEEVVAEEPGAPAPVFKVDLNTPELVAGEKVFSKCLACHGQNGEGKESQKAAHIGGQYDWYIVKQLTDMKAGVIRINEAMNPTLKGLSEKDIKDVAAYISKLPWKK
jgi:cytochrome c553